MNQELAKHHQEALTLIEECRRRLLDKYGARQVIPCGSVIGQGPWHRGSDIDLAVAGLSERALEIATDDLQGLLPGWLHVDLIPLERVYPEVRQRLLGGSMTDESLFSALKTRLQDELTALTRLQAGLETALQRLHKEDEEMSEFDIRALSTYLDDFYSGCERICERVAVSLDGGTPAGAQWHRILLGQMADPGGFGRPALFSGTLLLELDEYRRFRHRARHIYGYELDGARVLELAERAAVVLRQVRMAVTQFDDWLDQQNQDSQSQESQ